MRMLGFMDYVQHAFYRASGWDYENVYPSLTATARSMNTPYNTSNDLLTLARSSGVPNAAWHSSLIIVTRFTQFCDILFPWECRSRGWLAFLPLLLHSFALYIAVEHDRLTQHHTRISADTRLTTEGAIMDVGGMAWWKTN